MNAVLFDIDGTLCRLGGAGREALARGAARALHVPLDAARAATAQMDFRGRIDPALIDELVRRLDREPGARDAAVAAAYLAELPATLAGATRELLPGVREILAALEARGDVLVGLLTGNVRAGARLKLGCFDLGWLVDRPGGFGEDGRDRREVAEAGVAAAVAAGAHPERVFVVGDTEHDVAAARHAGARAVGVCTGWTGRDILEASRPDLLLVDLTGAEGLLEMLL